MTWLAFAYFLSLGTLSYHGQIFDPGGYGDMILSSSYQTTLGVEAQLFDDHAFIGGSVQTWESQIDLVNFAPSEGIHTFSASGKVVILMLYSKKGGNPMPWVFVFWVMFMLLVSGGPIL